MAIYACAQCDHEDHFSAFKVADDRNADESADAFDDNPDYEDELECPECGSANCYET